MRCHWLWLWPWAIFIFKRDTGPEKANEKSNQKNKTKNENTRKTIRISKATVYNNQADNKIVLQNGNVVIKTKRMFGIFCAGKVKERA